VKKRVDAVTCTQVAPWPLQKMKWFLRKLVY
jgi:hypothetical protein